MIVALLSVDQVLSQHPSAAFLTIQVHDELVFEMQSSKTALLIPSIRDAMTSVLTLDVPLVVNCSVGDDWGSMSPFDA